MLERIRLSAPLASPILVIPMGVNVLREQAAREAEAHVCLVIDGTPGKVESGCRWIYLVQTFKVFPVPHCIGNNFVPLPLDTVSEFRKVDLTRVKGADIIWT